MAVAHHVCSRVTLWLAAIATGAFVAAFALLALGYTGVLDLERFVPAVEQNLTANLFAGDHVTIGSLGIRRDGWSLAISFDNLLVRNPQGRSVLTVPRGGLGVDTLSLLTGNISVRQVEFDGLDVKVAWGRDGAWRIAEGSNDDAVAQGAASGAGAAAGAGEMLGNLDRIVLRDAQVTLVNERLNKSLAIDHVSGDFGRRGGVMSVKLAGKSPSGPFSIEGRADSGGSRAFSFDAKDIGVKDWEDLTAPDPPATYDAPLSISGKGAFDAAGAIAALDVSVGLGAGTLAFHGGDDIAVVIDEAGGQVTWDDKQKLYLVKDLHFTMGETNAVLEGQAAPPTAGSQTWTAALATKQAVVGPGKPGETPIPVQSAMQIHVTPATGQLVIDNLALTTPTVAGSLALESHPDGDLRTMKFSMNIDKGSAPEMIRLWPRTIVTDARDWCRDHILGGDASGTLTLDLDGANFYAVTHAKAAEAERVHGQVHFTNAGLQLFDPGQSGPPLSFPDASVQFNGRVFKATASSGDFALSGPGRKLHVQDAVFFVPDTTPAARVPSRATARVQGGVDALAELVQHEPMKSYLGATLDPALVKGDFDGNLAIDIPLGKNIAPSEIKTTGNGALSNFSLDQALGPHKFENASLTMALEPGSFKVSGAGQYMGVAATMEATKVGKEPGGVTFNLALDNSVRKRIGVGDIPGLEGVIGVKVKAPWTKTSADVEVDLAKAMIEAPMFGTLKAAGKPGKASFTIKTNEQGLVLQNLAIEAGALVVKGSGQIGASGGLQSLKLSPLRLFASDDIHADIVNDNSVWRVSAHGGQLDVRPILLSLQKQSPTTKSTADADLALDAEFSSALGPKNAALTQLQISMTRIGGVSRHISLQGRLGLGTATYVLDATGQAKLHLGDAGAGMKYFDLYSRMEGGVLDAEWVDQAGAQTGDLQMSAFTLRGEPALAQLAAAGQPDKSANKSAAPFDPNTVDFQKLKARFERANGKIDISDAVVYNPIIGMTTEGFIDFRGNAIDLSGAFIPAYAFNSLAGRIPLLGVLLSGGANEGVFSVNYRLAGALDKSTLTVNPLSAATPGILRKLMGVIDGTIRPTPTPAAASLTAQP